MEQRRLEILCWADLLKDDPSLLPEIEIMVKQWSDDLETYQKSVEDKIPNPTKPVVQTVLLEIYAGGGGSEAQDFAAQIERMLLLFCEKQNLKPTDLFRYPTPTGLRGTGWSVKGIDAWNLLRPEHGSHRLSRISPYDKNNRRQTSFARVEVLPMVQQTKVVLDLNSVEISRFKGSGPGGQHRNKTETGIRAKHLPTGLEATISGGRSLKVNQEQALQVLQARLADREKSSIEQQTEKYRGESAGFGSRIRSYVVHPKPLVHDHQTGNKTNKLDKVLNGDLFLVR